MKKEEGRRTAGILTLLGLAALAASSLLRPAARPDRAAAWASLVDAERSFARTSEEKGVREAFLAWLGPDAVVFRPAPVEGRPVYERMDPAVPAVLTWGPEIADVAASGELGYTSGPYELRPGRGAEPSGFGHYVSIWKKQPDGAWRVVLDAGVPHPPPGPPPATVRDLGPPPSGEAPELSPEALREAEAAFVKTAAGAFAERAGRDGLRAAYRAFAAEGVRAYRPGRPPLVGKPALLETVPARAGRVSPGSRGRRAAFQAGLAYAGDLAYEFGTFESGKAPSEIETSAYLRIWRRPPRGEWAIVLDLELPVPRDKGDAASPS
jgi:ketosteroid isomerase-like protein